jgi:S1-C subfamily serine protease
MLVELDGRRVSDMNDLQRLLDGDAIGRTLPVTVVRDGSSRRLQLVPEELTT